jgi:hypothetical protein
MQAIQAVLDLVKERDEIADELETYENWFESLVGENVVLSIVSKRKTRFVDCVVTEFTPGEGWVLQSEDDDVHVVTFEDFVRGRLYIQDKKPSKHVTFAD